MTWKFEINRVLHRRLVNAARKDIHWEDWSRKDKLLFMFKYLNNKSAVDFHSCMNSFILNHPHVQTLLADLFLDEDIDNLSNAIILAESLKDHLINYYEDEINDRIDTEFIAFQKENNSGANFNSASVLNYQHKHGE